MGCIIERVDVQSIRYRVHRGLWFSLLGMFVSVQKGPERYASDWTNRLLGIVPLICNGGLLSVLERPGVARVLSGKIVGFSERHRYSANCFIN